MSNGSFVRTLTVNLATSWTSPNLEIADMCDKEGFHIIDRWWLHKDMGTTCMDAEKCVELCDVVVLDMRTCDFATHHYAGSHVVIGMAIAMGKPVIVILPQGAKPYTSLVAKCCVHTTEEAVAKLRAYNEFLSALPSK